MQKHHKHHGFSLVEMAIVMVIIGLIVAAVTVGKSTMKSAETLKAYQKIVVPCVAAVSEGIRNGSTPIMPHVPTVKLDGNTIGCYFTENTVTVSGAPDDLQKLMAKNLHNGIDVSVKENIVMVYAPGVSDNDGDGVNENSDAFPLNLDESVDTDGDGIGNNEDTDDDGDGYLDLVDDFPLDATENTDTDGDGTGDNADTDDDGDGVEDSDDAFPLDASESVDTDGDGVGNNADTDDDGDGVEDSADAFPLDAAENTDTDGDGTGNNADTDDDGDGIEDSADAFPLDATENTDTDGDGIGNNADTDDDGDGVEDSADAFPLDAAENTDTDGDGTGNNADTDDDGDGVEDSADAFPLNASDKFGFIANTNGTVTDSKTGLILLKNANCFGRKEWQDAMDVVAGLAGNGTCGLVDGSTPGQWRLPTRGELDVLIAAKNSSAFSGVQTDFYWSSTTYAVSTSNAWNVNLGSGYVDYYGKEGDYYVWPVRGGQ